LGVLNYKLCLSVLVFNGLNKGLANVVSSQVRFWKQIERQTFSTKKPVPISMRTLSALTIEPGTYNCERYKTNTQKNRVRGVRAAKKARPAPSW
jgi:hypothetical protein